MSDSNSEGPLRVEIVEADLVENLERFDHRKSLRSFNSR
jgi:hypothetical protein